jgi:hypothetical protein
MMSVRHFAEGGNSIVTTDVERPANSPREGFIYWDPCLGMSPVQINSPGQFIVPHVLVCVVSLLVLLFFV